MSKSGLYAHFGSKEELQLATIDAASEIFVREVIEPRKDSRGSRAARRARRRVPLVPRAQGLSRRLLLRRRAGGARHAPRPCAREAARGEPALARLRRAAGARRPGDGRAPADEDPAQLAFEIDAMLKMATAVFVLHDDAEALERARRGVEIARRACEDRGVTQPHPWDAGAPDGVHIWKTLGYRFAEGADGRSRSEWDARPRTRSRTAGGRSSTAAWSRRCSTPRWVTPASPASARTSRS